VAWSREHHFYPIRPKDSCFGPPLLTRVTTADIRRYFNHCLTQRKGPWKSALSPGLGSKNPRTGTLFQQGPVLPKRRTFHLNYDHPRGSGTFTAMCVASGGLNTGTIGERWLRGIFGRDWTEDFWKVKPKGVAGVEIFQGAGTWGHPSLAGTKGTRGGALENAGLVTIKRGCGKRGHRRRGGHDKVWERGGQEKTQPTLSVVGPCIWAGGRAFASCGPRGGLSGGGGDREKGRPRTASAPARWKTMVTRGGQGRAGTGSGPANLGRGGPGAFTGFFLTSDGREFPPGCFLFWTGLSVRDSQGPAPVQWARQGGHGAGRSAAELAPIGAAEGHGFFYFSEFREVG